MISGNSEKDVNISDKNFLMAIDGIIPYLIEKNRKLAFVLYRITDDISDSEPLKWSTREAVLNAQKRVHFLPNGAAGLSYKKGLVELLNDYNASIAYVDLMAMIGLISEMNAKIINSEFKILIDKINNKINNSNEINGIKSALFVDDAIFFDNKSALSGTFSQDKGVKDIKDSAYGLSNISDFIRESKAVVNFRPKDKVKLSDKGLDRSTEILNVIKIKGECGIKDISAIIRNCSEKTIQRELIKLVSLGRLKRTGERRWSRYSLV